MRIQDVEDGHDDEVLRVERASSCDEVRLRWEIGYWEGVDVLPGSGTTLSTLE